MLKQLEVPSVVLAIDPGGTTGWAYFKEGELLACGYGAFDVVSAREVWPDSSLKGGVCIIEYPQAYPGPKSKQDPNDIMRTAWRAGGFALKYRHMGMLIEEVFPNGWKGTVSKELTYERVLDRLSESEKKLLLQSKPAKSKKLDHNMVDAVGIGLWRVYRRVNS